MIIKSLILILIIMVTSCTTISIPVNIPKSVSFNKPYTKGTGAIIFRTHFTKTCMGNKTNWTYVSFNMQKRYGGYNNKSAHFITPGGPDFSYLGPLGQLSMPVDWRGDNSTGKFSIIPNEKAEMLHFIFLDPGEYRFNHQGFKYGNGKAFTKLIQNDYIIVKEGKITLLGDFYFDLPNDCFTININHNINDLDWGKAYLQKTYPNLPKEYIRPDKPIKIGFGQSYYE